MKAIVIKLKSDNDLRALIRGQAVRPAQQHTDRRKQANRRACRGHWSAE